MENDIILSNDGQLTGQLTGGERQCTLEGCNGPRVGIRWNDGTLTWPCIKGIEFINGKQQIMA